MKINRALSNFSPSIQKNTAPFLTFTHILFPQEKWLKIHKGYSSFWGHREHVWIDYVVSYLLPKECSLWIPIVRYYHTFNYGTFFFFQERGRNNILQFCTYGYKNEFWGYCSFQFLQSMHYFVFLPYDKEKVKRQSKKISYQRILLKLELVFFFCSANIGNYLNVEDIRHL